MNYVDLLDDSDDDIPLLPPKNAVKRSGVSLDMDKDGPVPKKNDRESSIVELLSSDDKLPILLPNRIQPSTKGTPDYDSDKTEEYSNSSSLPNLDRDDNDDFSDKPNTDSWGHYGSDLQTSSGCFTTTPVSSVNASKDSMAHNNKLPDLPNINTNATSETRYSDKQYTAVKLKETTSVESSATSPNKQVSKKAEKQEQQRLRREEKERQTLEKKRQAALKAAERESKRASKPGECHRHMLIEVDEAFESTEMGIRLEACCLANGVSMKYVTPAMSNTIVFKRKLTDLASGSVSYVKEDNMALIVQMTDLVDLIANANTGKTLESYIQSVMDTYQSTPTVAGLGFEKYFRTLKTQSNRAFRDEVLGTNAHAKKNKNMTKISRVDFEQAVTALQMTINTVFVHYELEEEIAAFILRLNKSIAEAPVKKDKYRQQALSVRATGLKLGKDNQGARLVWQRMLQESRNISAEVSIAIVNEWPSPLLLHQKYKECSALDGELLLQDIEVRRGGGVVQTRRRVGREVSRRVYEMFTKTDPTFIIK